MRLGRRKPGAAVDGVRIATAWTPELVRGLIRWQQEDRLTGVLTHTFRIALHAARAEVGSADDQRTLFGFVTEAKRAVPARVTVMPVGEREWDEGQERLADMRADRVGDTPAVRALRVYGETYWAGRPQEQRGSEDARPALEAALRLSPGLYDDLVVTLRHPYQQGSALPTLTLQMLQDRRLVAEDLLPSLGRPDYVHFDVVRYALTVYPMFGGASARQNRFFRQTESNDAW